MDLTAEQWKIVESLLPRPRLREDGRERPWRDPQDVLNGIMWVLRTGAPWKDLPSRYPPYQTCHRRFQLWDRIGALEQVLKALAKDLMERGKLDLTETYVDGSFAPQKREHPGQMAEVPVRDSYSSGVGVGAGVSFLSFCVSAASCFSTGTLVNVKPWS